MAAIILNKDNFEREVYESELPVLVDFWAPWCGPCNEILPIVEELAEKLAGKAKVCKINTDEHPQLAVAFKVMTIPTLITFHKGALLQQKVYPRTEEEILALFGELRESF